MAVVVREGGKLLLGIAAHWPDSDGLRMHGDRGARRRGNGKDEISDIGPISQSAARFSIGSQFNQSASLTYG
jgi:hypothetical protein